MKRLLFPLLFIICLLLSPAARATVWTAENLPMVHLQDARRYVCNPDGVLSASAVDSIDAILYRLEQTKGVETIVVVVKQVADGDCYTLGMNLARKYGVGNKEQNSGLIVILSTEDRRYYILTGTGMEGTLPDAICKRIETRVMVPRLKEGDWDGAMTEGIKAINSYIEGDESLKAMEKDDDLDVGISGLILLVAFIFLFAFLLTYANMSHCPKCGKRAYRGTAEKYLYTRDGWDYFQVVTACYKCGYSTSKIVRRRHEDDDDGLLTGAVLGSMMGRGSSGWSGGGFGGGSFGGGSFGGGGAGGGF